MVITFVLVKLATKPGYCPQREKSQYLILLAMVIHRLL